MNELLNFHNTPFIFEHNWLWLLAAFVVGAWVGFTYCIPSKSSK